MHLTLIISLCNFEWIKHVNIPHSGLENGNLTILESEQNEKRIGIYFMVYKKLYSQLLKLNTIYNKYLGLLNLELMQLATI